MIEAGAIGPEFERMAKMGDVTPDLWIAGGCGLPTALHAIDLAQIRLGDRVVVQGAGPVGLCAAAVISRVAGKVIGIERQHELVDVARERLARLGYDNVEIVEGDGTRGWPASAPYDAILAAASGSHVPRPLLDQLKPGGRLVMPLGQPGAVQQLVRVAKQTDGTLQQSDLGAVRFVPLIGAEGWEDSAT